MDGSGPQRAGHLTGCPTMPLRGARGTVTSTNFNGVTPDKRGDTTDGCDNRAECSPGCRGTSNLWGEASVQSTRGAWRIGGSPVLSRSSLGGYAGVMSELPVDGAPGMAGAARDAARGHVVYLTEHGVRVPAIVPAEFAEVLEGMSGEDARELLEDLADAAAARQALAEPGESIPWEQVRAEAGL